MRLPDRLGDANTSRDNLLKETFCVQKLLLLRPVYTIAKHMLCRGECWSSRGKELVYSDVDSD